MRLVLKYFVFFILLCLGAGAYLQFNFSSKALSNKNESFILDIPPGSTFQSVFKQLNNKDLKINPWAFKIWAKLNLASSKLKVGEYSLETSWSAKRMLDEILSGRPLLHKVIIKEGYNIYDVKKEIEATTLQSSNREFEKLLSNPGLLQKMGVPTQEIKAQGITPTLEGFLFPETYSYQKYSKLDSLVQEMLKLFDQRAVPILSQHPKGQTPEGRYRLLILASMVEKESGSQEEQPLIASVFWNRLQKKMKMQSDPTTIYGLLPIFDGNLTRNQLTAPTPYNTYTVKELPIAPISNPGETALRAVVQPAVTNYIFFVSRGDGSHVFSEDYKTHKKYVEQYQLRPRKIVR